MKIVLTILIVTTSSLTFSQKLDTLMNGDARYQYSRQLSGMAVYKDRLYMPAEKCGKVVIAKVDGSIDTIIDLRFEKLNLNPTIVEMESIAIYRHWLLITDESKDYHQLYSYNLEDGTLAIVNSSNKLKDDTGYLGMEGIAVNEKDSICYVLKERNSNFQSEMRQFKIWDDGVNIQLKFISNIAIQHKKKNVATRNVRYSDLVYDNTNRQLLLLKSYYAGRTDPETYYSIDSVYLPENGLIQRNVISNLKNELCLYNLTDDIKTLAAINLVGNKKYSTNIEGICIYKTNILLVSDNSQSHSNCATISNERTLLLKYPVLKYKN